MPANRCPAWGYVSKRIGRESNPQALPGGFRLLPQAGDYGTGLISGLSTPGFRRPAVFHGLSLHSLLFACGRNKASRPSQKQRRAFRRPVERC